MGGMSHDGRPRWGSGHAVSWYSLDSEGIEAVARFIAHGWSESDSALIIASAHHRERIDAAMSDLGVDPELMAAQGRYVTRDAEATLRRFVDGGVLAAPTLPCRRAGAAHDGWAEMARTCGCSAS